MTEKSFVCHLFIILARDAPKAVIFRRGPRLWTQLILWDTQTDTFTEGQWFRGTLYLQRCDLSPDGSKLLYLAAKHFRSPTPQNPFPASWTAVSRPPYLTTLATAKAHGTYDGGGYFEDNDIICINQSRYVPDPGNVPPIKLEKINVPDRVVFQPALPNGKFFYENSLFPFLLECRGWQPVEDSDESESFFPARWRKANPGHTHTLWMTRLPVTSSQPDPSEFKVTSGRDEVGVTIRSDEWADWDHRGRLVYTSEGKLFAGHVRKDGIMPVQLADFRANQVRLIRSPAWAKTWDQLPDSEQAN